MKLGAALPVTGFDGEAYGPRSLARGAEMLEELGYDSVWVFDAIGRGFIIPDPFMALTAAATATRDIELGAGVIQLPLRPTADVAYRALTLHHLSEGRFTLGVGPGSTRADAEAFGTAFDERFRRFDAELPTLRELLAGGKSGTVDLAPWKASLGGPPVLYAAWKGGWIERAADEADGWIASAANADDATLEGGVARFRARGGARCVVTNLQCGRELGTAIERLQRMKDLGFDEAVVFDLHATRERWSALREAVAPS